MDELQELFLNSQGKYKKHIQFNSLLIISFVFMFFAYYYNNTQYAHIIALVLFATFIANKYVKIEQNKLEDMNQQTIIKLNLLQNKFDKYLINKMQFLEKTSGKKMFSQALRKQILKKNYLDSLYIDANLIHFLHSILPLYNYNPNEFYLLLKGTNQILKIRNDIEKYFNANNQYPHNISEMMEIAIGLKTNTINNMHNFIYTVPKIKIMNEYIDKVIERYGVLISRNVNKIHEYYLDNIQKIGINSSTKFVSYNTTKPFDKYSNHQTILNKGERNKLIQFYI